MNKKKEIVPKFRFPKYVNSEQWISTELSSLLDYERPDLYIVESDNYKNEGIPVLTANKSFILGYTDEKNNIYSRVPVIIFDDFTTEKKYVDFPFKVKSSAIKILKPKGNNVLKFVFELMNTINFEAKEHKRYYISTYQKLFVYVPKDVKEQQNIADCLSTTDDLIDAESRKLKVLEKYKKGLMQKLFPVEGKTLPEWRFPEFKHCGNWEQVTLTKVAFYENGKAHENYIEEYGKYIVVNSKFIATDGEVTKLSNTANLLAKRGDILMVLSDVPNGRALAKCYFVDENDKYTVNQRICRLRPYDIDSLFLFYYVNRNKYFLDFDDGVKQTNLKKSDVLACPLLKPKEKREQQKIADCLSEIDTMITEQLKKIERLETHKKGLLQGLFPSLEEVDV